jgi:hypothetical protein
MTEKEPIAGRKDPEMVGPDDPYDLRGVLKRLGGSQSDHWNKVLIDQTVYTLGLNRSDGEARRQAARDCEHVAGATGWALECSRSTWRSRSGTSFNVSGGRCQEPI